MKLNYAIQFAYEKHKGQKRKLTNEEYFFHPIEVAITVARYSNDMNAIIAAVLHDTLEDTDATPDEIKNIFGDEVLRIVLECSEKDKSLKWKVRKEEMLKSYPCLSKEAFLIILADKVCNLNSIKYYYNEHIWENFNANEEKQKWLYTKTLELFKACPYDYPELIKEFEDLVYSVFSRI